jgi:hypothetical protein
MSQDKVSSEPGGGWRGRVQAVDGPIHLRLYIAGGTPNSVRAEDNLAAAMVTLGAASDWFILEVIDVFRESRMAMKDGVLVTPTLIAGGPGARTLIVGDLADDKRLSSVLQRLASGGGAIRTKL